MVEVISFIGYLPHLISRTSWDQHGYSYAAHTREVAARSFILSFTETKLCTFYIKSQFRLWRPAGSCWLIRILRLLQPDNKSVPVSHADAVALGTLLKSTCMLWGLSRRMLMHESGSDHSMPFSNQLWMRAQLGRSVLLFLFKTPSLQPAAFLLWERRSAPSSKDDGCVLPPLPQCGPCNHLSDVCSFLRQL